MKKQILNTDSYSPLYKQLMQKLRSDIQNGVYPVHSRIPSEQELCDTYQVSRVTVRKALAPQSVRPSVRWNPRDLWYAVRARAPLWACPASARICGT